MNKKAFPPSVIPQLSSDPESPFPATELALDYPPGLLALGGDLSPTRLINAYRHGIFPWYSDNQPILWWSPAPRCVLYPNRVHVSRRLQRHYNQGRFILTADQAFKQVIAGCATPRPGDDRTWITPGMQAAFIRLFELGIAHCVEVWTDADLVGGIYGIVLGSLFFGESMFSGTTDAGKVALVALCQQLQRWQFTLLDCQISNPHLLRMGAEEIPRKAFQRHLKDANGPSCWGKDFLCAAHW